MRKPLTPRQQEIYDFIAEEVIQRGIPPTIRELADHFGMRSSNGAREALNVLAHKGYIRRRDKLSRGIEIIEPVETSRPISGGGRSIPLISAVPQSSNQQDGTNAYGTDTTRHIIIDASLLPREGDVFAAVVADDSMCNHGVRKGDMVIAVAVKPGEEGDLAVALVEGCLVVRRYGRSSQGVVLQSDGDERLWQGQGTDTEIHVLGNVHGLVRHFTSNDNSSQ